MVSDVKALPVDAFALLRYRLPTCVVQCLRGKNMRIDKIRHVHAFKIGDMLMTLAFNFIAPAQVKAYFPECCLISPISLFISMQIPSSK